MSLMCFVIKHQARFFSGTKKEQQLVGKIRANGSASVLVHLRFYIFFFLIDGTFYQKTLYTIKNSIFLRIFIFTRTTWTIRTYYKRTEQVKAKKEAFLPYRNPSQFPSQFPGQLGRNFLGLFSYSEMYTTKINSPKSSLFLHSFICFIIIFYI